MKKIFCGYLGRVPTEYEVSALLQTHEQCRFNDPNLDLLEIAVKCAAESGNPNLAYITGAMRNMFKLGIFTSDDYWQHEAQRDMKRGRV